MFTQVSGQAIISLGSSQRMLEKSTTRKKANEIYSQEIKSFNDDENFNRNTNINLISSENKGSFRKRNDSYSEELLEKINKKNKKLKRLDNKEQYRLKFDLFITITSLSANFIFFLLYAIETFYDKIDINQEPLKTLIFVEFIINFYFVFEYFIFCYNYPGNKLKYIFSLFPLIDKASIASVFLNFFLTESNTNFAFIRIMRFLRLAKRIRTITNLSNIIKKISSNSEISQIVDPVKMQFITMVSTLFVYFLIGSGVTLTIQDFFENSFSMPGLNFIDSLYFIIISSTSVGYGDICPQGKVARVVAIFSIIFFIYIISDQIGKMINTLSTWGSGITEFESEDHIIIFSNSITDIKIFVERIKEKTPKRPILIVSESDMNISSLNDDEDNSRCSLLISNFQDEYLIQRAKINCAKDLFFFSNFDFDPEDLNDSKINNKKKYIKNIETMLFLRLINFRKINPDLCIYIFSINFENFCFKFPSIENMGNEIAKFGSKKLDLGKNKSLTKINKNTVYYNLNEKETNNPTKEKNKQMKKDWKEVQKTYKNFIRTQSIKLKDQNYDLKDYSSIKKFFSLRKIKNSILAKSSINPGFLTFIQNLFFKPKIRLASLDNCFKRHKNTILEEYHNSSFNDIIIKELPKEFENCTFNDFVKAIYFSSIYDYSKTYTNNKINYKFPILVIGVIKRKDIKLQHFESNERLYLFPKNMVLEKDCRIVCIANKFNNNMDYIFGNNSKTIQNESYKKVSKTIEYYDKSNDYISSSSNDSNDKDIQDNEKSGFIDSNNNMIGTHGLNEYYDDWEIEKLEKNSKNIEYDEDEDSNLDEVNGGNNNYTNKNQIKNMKYNCLEKNHYEFNIQSDMDIPLESSINNKFKENLSKSNIIYPFEYNNKIKDYSILDVKDTFIHEEQKDNNINLLQNSYLNQNIKNLHFYNCNTELNHEKKQSLTSKDFETPRKYNENTENINIEDLFSLKKTLFNKENKNFIENIDKNIIKEDLNFNHAKADIMKKNNLIEKNVLSFTLQKTEIDNKIINNQSKKKLSILINDINFENKMNMKSKLNSTKNNSIFNFYPVNHNDNFTNPINNTPNNHERFSQMFIYNLKHNKRKSLYSHQNKVAKSLSKSMMEKNSYSSFFNCLKKYLTLDPNEGISNENSSTNTTGCIKDTKGKIFIQ